MDRSIMLDNRSKDSYLLLHWQDRMSEQRRAVDELEGEARRNYENVKKAVFGNRRI